MAGVPHYKLAMDPAMLRLEQMRKARYKYFRWTPRTALITFNYVVVVPFLFGVVAYKTDGKYDLRGKRKGDLIYEY